MKNSKELVIYQTKSGALELKGDFKRETIWATQFQIAQIFDIDRTVATKHINKILGTAEVDEKSNVQKMHIANGDRPTSVYSLDIILAVGYRSNSSRAIQFRQWATKTLHKHIVDGFTINRNQVKKNYDVFSKAVADIKSLLPSSMEDTSNITELIKSFALTWLSLDAYDKSELPTRGAVKREVEITGDELINNFINLKTTLSRQKLASDLFAAERDHGLIQGIVGNIYQSFGGKDLYPGVELKAAHLLYFVVKNHPFTDGNKRCGALAFVWFLSKAGLLNRQQLSPEAVTAITLLVAESKPSDKDWVVGLILLLLNH
jgi:prophage maintenance system killer protein